MADVKGKGGSKGGGIGGSTSAAPGGGDPTSTTGAAGGAGAPTGGDARARKLDPIVEAIRQRDYRRAVTLADKKDVASMPLAKALKATALWKGGAREDAVHLMDDLLRTKPTDVEVVMRLVDLLRGMNDSARAVEVLEHAVTTEANATNEDLHRQLVYTHVRMDEWKKCQLVCMKLAKMAGDKPEYAAWMALALHGQVNTHEAVHTTPATYPAPNPATGGGRGFGVAPVAGGDTVGSGGMRLADMVLSTALDKLTPQQRHSEFLGLYIHTLTRLGRAGDAYKQVIEGKYKHIASKRAVEAVAAGAADNASNGTGSGGGTGPDAEDLAGADDGKTATGGGGEGDGDSAAPAVPVPFQPVDHYRYKAALLVQMRAWTGALEAFGTLLSEHDVNDWAYHQGVAYCAGHVAAGAIEAAGGDGSTTVVAVRTQLGALPTTDGSALTGVPKLDAALVPLLRDAVEGNTSPALVAGDAEVLSSRTGWLALLQLLAVRLEIAHRLVTATHAGRPDVVAAGKEAAACAGGQYVSLLTHFLTRCGGKPWCMADITPFLVPLFPAIPAAVAKWNAEAGDTLLGFMQPGAAVVALPFMPVVPAGTAADVAPTSPLFRWSFLLPSTALRDVVAAATALRDASTLSSAMREEVIALVAAGREAGLAKAAAEAKSARPVTRKAGASGGSSTTPAGGAADDDDDDAFAIVGGGKGGKGGKGRKGGKGGTKPAAGPAPASEAAPTPTHTTGDADPHGVREAMQAAGAIVLDATQSARITAIRAQVRALTTANQVLRYLGAAAGRDGGQIGNAGDGARNAALWSFIDACLTAWTLTIPLTWTTPESKDVHEGDDLVLLAVHALCELGFAALAGAPTVPGLTIPDLPATAVTGSMAADVPLSALLAARQYFVEAYFALEVACEVSKYNGKLHTAAMRIAGWLGSNAGVLSHADKLRVKYIMRDTWNRFILPHYMRLLWTDAAQAVCNDMVAMHANAAGESGDHVKVAMREGHFSQVMDLTRLRVRLAQSGSLATARATYGQLGFTTAVHTWSEAQNHVRRLTLASESKELTFDPSLPALLRLRDNDDTDALACWDPPSLPLLQELRHGLALVSPTAAPADNVDWVRTCAAAVVDYATAAAPTMVTAGGDALGGSGATGSASPVTAITAAVLHFASPLHTGNNGGSFERLWRRTARDASLIYRHNVQQAVGHALEGRVEGLVRSVDTLARLYEVVGLHPHPAAAAAAAAMPASAVRACMFGDVLVGTVGYLDAGVSTERQVVRGLLVATLHQLLAACAAKAVGGAAADARVRDHLLSAASTLATVSAAITDARRLPLPRQLAHPADAPPSSGKGASTPAVPAPLNPAMLVEATHLVQQVVPLATIALGHLARAGGVRAVPTLTAGATGTASSSSEAVAVCAAALRSSLTAAAGDQKALFSVLEVNVEKAKPVIFGGFVVSACASTFLRTALPIHFDGTPAGKREVPSADLSGGVGKGVAYTREVAVDGERAQRKRIEDSLIHVGASYTNTVNKLTAEIDAKLSFLAGVVRM